MFEFDQQCYHWVEPVSKSLLQTESSTSSCIEYPELGNLVRIWRTRGYDCTDCQKLSTDFLAIRAG